MAKKLVYLNVNAGVKKPVFLNVNAGVIRRVFLNVLAGVKRLVYQNVLALVIPFILFSFVLFNWPLPSFFLIFVLIMKL